MKQLPHNIEAEQALLGALLANNNAIEMVSGFLEPEHFFEPVHGRIYDAIIKLHDLGQVADVITLKVHFDLDDALTEMGGAMYLVRMAASAATIINTEDYGKTIRDLAIRRELMDIGSQVHLTAEDSPIDMPAMEQIEDAEKMLLDLGEINQADSGAQKFSQILTTTIGQIETAWQNPSDLTGVTTGIQSINTMLGGLHPTDLIILAGRPAMGKTALAVNISYSAARQWVADQKVVEKDRRGGARVAFFSLEMSSDQLTNRILSQQTGISSEKMRRGRLIPADFQKISRAGAELADLPLYIDDTPALSIAGLRSRARRLKRRFNIDLIVVDYLQLMAGTSRRSSENRVQEVSEITRGLKTIAKELRIPVLALSQLSRQVEQRENKRPLLSDLRESGSIEQDSDMVTFLFREEYYKEKQEPTEGTPEHEVWRADMERMYGKAEFIVSKQRHGPTGILKLHFDAETTTFTDRAKSEYLPSQAGF